MNTYTFEDYLWPTEDELTIVVPIHGQLDVTKNFLESYKRQSVKCPLLFIDDASPDDSVSWLSANGYSVIVPSERLWFNGMLNETIASVKTPYCGFLNNDLVLGVDFLRKTLEAFKKSGYDILVPYTVEYFDSQKQLDKERSYKIAKLYRQEGWCMLFRTKSVRKLPKIPAKNLRLWYGDTWVYHHAWTSGQKVGVMMHNHIAHVESATIKADPEEKKKGVHLVIAEDKKEYEKKYSWVLKKRKGLYRLIPKSLRKRFLPYY